MAHMVRNRSGQAEPLKYGNTGRRFLKIWRNCCKARHVPSGANPGPAVLYLHPITTIGDTN